MHVFVQTRWQMSLCPKANPFVGVVVWALPLFCCFAVSVAKRKSGWGICGSSCFFLGSWCFVVVMICLFCTGQWSPCTIFSHRLYLFQDRALVRHRPIPRKKSAFRNRRHCMHSKLISGKYKLVERPGGSNEGVGRKKKGW